MSFGNSGHDGSRMAVRDRIPIPEHLPLCRDMPGADVIAVACKLFYSSLQQLPACKSCASFYSCASDSLTMMSVLPCSSVASAVAPPQLKEFLTSIEWESKDEAFVDAVIQELADNDIMVPGNITLPAYVGSTAV